nr:site-specific integrase [Desulfovibrio sp. ZJ200]
MSRLDNERARFLTREEARLLLDELGKHSLELRDMATLSLFCGLRAGEIFKLQWADINMDTGTIFLRGTKAGNSRYAFFTDEVRHILTERAKSSAGRDQLLFPATNGNKRERVSKTFRKVVKELGLNDGIDDPKQQVVFHTLRHTFASWLAQGQIPLYNIQRLMGHSEARMVQRYAHLSSESMRQAVNVLNGALEPTEGRKEQARVIRFRKQTN